MIGRILVMWLNLKAIFYCSFSTFVSQNMKYFPYFLLFILWFYFLHKTQNLFGIYIDMQRRGEISPDSFLNTNFPSQTDSFLCYNVSLSPANFLNIPGLVLQQTSAETQQGGRLGQGQTKRANKQHSQDLNFTSYHTPTALK